MTEYFNDVRLDETGDGSECGAAACGLQSANDPSNEGAVTEAGDCGAVRRRGEAAAAGGVCPDSPKGEHL